MSTVLAVFLCFSQNSALVAQMWRVSKTLQAFLGIIALVGRAPPFMVPKFVCPGASMVSGCRAVVPHVYTQRAP